jgi:hypothetical protein
MSKITASNSETIFKVVLAILVRRFVTHRLWVLERFVLNVTPLMLQGLMPGEAGLEMLV